MLKGDKCSEKKSESEASECGMRERGCCSLEKEDQARLPQEATCQRD